MAESLFSPADPTKENPSVSVNFVRNVFNEVNASQFTTNSTTLSLEIVMLNFEPLQILEFFNSSSDFIDDCANKVLAMYPVANLKKLNVHTSPEIDLTFTRIPKPTAVLEGTISAEQENLKFRYFLANLTLRITECEVIRIKEVFAKAVSAIVIQINDAVAQYNTNPVYPQ